MGQQPQQHCFLSTATPPSRPRGFTLIEILIVVIVLGILASLVIPQFSKASEDLRIDALRAQLRTVRSAIQVYQMQHLGQLPDLSSTWKPLLTQTNAQGGATGTQLFGPYLSAPPVNSLTGGSNVSTKAGARVDWVWTPASGRLVAVDSRGDVFGETGQ
jgi:general secretion pathway protein G